MANYYPSEIARLVLGYLTEAQCPKSWLAFLTECPDLQEHYRLLCSGTTCDTSIEGKSLKDILHEYRVLKGYSKDAQSVESLQAFLEQCPDLQEYYSLLCSGTTRTTDMEGKPLRDILHEYQVSKEAAERSKQNEASSSHINANSSNPEVFKSHSKSKAEALNRFKVNQKHQSRATASPARFGEVVGQSPKITRSLVSIPSRASLSRQLQRVHATSLNFGADEDNSKDFDDANITQESAIDTDLAQDSVNPQNSKPAVTETASIVLDKMSPLNYESASKQNAGSSFLTADQANIQNCESALNQTDAIAPIMEVSEPMEMDDSEKCFPEASTPTSPLKIVIDSCMSIIQPDSVDELKDCSCYKQNPFTDDSPLQSNTHQNSILVPVSATGSDAVPKDVSALLPVSIGTPFNIKTQMMVNQNASNSNNSVKRTSQSPLCSTSTSGVNATVPLHQGTFNSNAVILPHVQNTSSIYQTFNPSLPAIVLPSGQTLLMPSSNTFPYQDSLYKIILPCGSQNCSNVTSDIVPVQSAPMENVLQTSSILDCSPIKIPRDYSPTKAFMSRGSVSQSDNAGNFVTVTSDNDLEKKKDKKRNKVTVKISPAEKPPERKKRRPRAPPRKKRRNLFSPQTNDTVTSDCGVVDDPPPVPFIPDPSPYKTESLSAMELLSNITENKNAQSPVLKAMISSAKILAEKGGRLNSTHVRSLEFSSPCSDVDEENNQETPKLKPSKNVSVVNGTRSFPRLKPKTACKSSSRPASLSSKNISAKKKGTNKCPSKEKSDVVATKQLNANKIVSSASMPDIMQITSLLEPSCKTPSHSPTKLSENLSEKKEDSKCTTSRKVNETADLVNGTIEHVHQVFSSKAADAMLNAIQEALHSSSLHIRKQSSSDIHKIQEMLKNAEIYNDLFSSPIKKTPLKDSSPTNKVDTRTKQFFPSSITDSDSNSEDLLPLSEIIASYRKAAQRSSVKSMSKALKDLTNETEMEENSSVLKPAKDNCFPVVVLKRLPVTDILNENNVFSHKCSEISEGADASVETKP